MIKEFKPTNEMLSAMNFIEDRRIGVNKQKPKAFINAIIFVIVSTVFLGGGIATIIITHQFNIMYFIVSFILAAIVMFLLVTLLESKKSKNIKKYEENEENNNLYINEIFIPLLKSIDKDFVYEQNSQIYEKYKEQYKEALMEIRESGNKSVISNKKTYIKTDGEIKGIINNINISIGQFYFRKLGSEDFYYSHQIFLVTNFNKRVKSITVLNPPFPHIFKTRMYHKILLDNQAFNKNFKTYSNNEIESRYILTPSFMEKMVKISEKLNGTFWFEGNEMMFHGYYKNDDKTNYFGLNIDKPIYEQSKDFHDMIYSVTQMIKLLELDSLVWE